MRFLIFVFFLLLFAIDSGAQSTGLSLGQLGFEGLKKNKEQYLRRFISSQKGNEFSFDQLRDDEQRLRNLVGIANLRLVLDTIGQDVNATFHVEEALTVFPDINFGRITGNYWYKLGLKDINWLGRGMLLSGYYQNTDARHNANIYLRAPYINGSRFGGSISLTRYASIEPLYFDEGTVVYLYDNNSFALSALYELALGNELELGGSLFQERYRKAVDQPLETPPGPDDFKQPKLLLKLRHVLNQINYFYFYQWGFDNQVNLETVYNVDDQNFFILFLNDTRYFKRISDRGNLAVRFRVGLSTNRQSPFAPFVVSSHVNIRGVGNRINRGTGSLVLNVEYRHTIFNKANFAGQLVGFSDAGTWRSAGGPLSDFVDPDIFRHFVGGGIRVIYKKAHNAILRADYGVDVLNANSRGLVLGLGQYF
jgi:outer membrane protein assembly factor BamA